MCIGVWTLEHPEYALILCTNRDEFLDRPTQSAHFHSFQEATGDHSGDVLSGLDERAGGTWFGINRTGRVALLTNITEQAVNFGTSRGSLVSSFLLSNSSQPIEAEISTMVPKDSKFSGFNLMLFAPRMKSDGVLAYETLLVTNHGAGGVLASRPLSADERRCGGMSNGIDGADATDWPKVKRAVQDFDAVLQSSSPSCPSDSELVDRLMEVLAWQCPDPILERSHLRNTVHVIPLRLKSDKDGVPAYYGTRLSTVLLVRRDGNVHFVEREIWQLGPQRGPVMAQPTAARVFNFRLGISL